MREHMNKRIKVGIFVDGDFIPSYDGAANRFHFLSRYIQEVTDIEIIIFHGYRGWSDIKLIKKEPFKTYIFPIKSYYQDLNLLASIIKQEGIEIIQFDNLEPILLQGIILSQLTNTYLVSEMHYAVRNLAKSLGASPKRITTIKRMERVVGNTVDHLICLSRDDKSFLKKNMGLSDSRISVVPSGVDLDNARFWGPNFRRKTILFLGNLFFEPNIEAVEFICKDVATHLRNFRFLIVGDCPEEISHRYKKANIKFTGTVTDLNLVFRESTIALAPIQERTGLRIKLLNYLAAGIPIIATSAAVSGFKNRRVFVIENNLSRYVKRILALFKARNEAMRLAKNGRRMIEEQFDWVGIARQTEKVYKRILKTDRKPKDKYLKKISRFKIKEPVWLEEAKHKGRFANRRSSLEKGFKYAVINMGRLHIFR